MAAGVERRPRVCSRQARNERRKDHCAGRCRTCALATLILCKNFFDLHCQSEWRHPPLLFTQSFTALVVDSIRVVRKVIGGFARRPVQEQIKADSLLRPSKRNLSRRKRCALESAVILD